MVQRVKTSRRKRARFRYPSPEEASVGYRDLPHHEASGGGSIEALLRYEPLVLKWWKLLERSEVQAERVDELGPNSFRGVHPGPTVLEHPDGSIFISLRAPSAEAATRVLEALVRERFELPRPPERIDEMNGVIREIAESEVSVSLFDGEEEFCVELPRKIFEDGHVPLREDEGFQFFVDRYSDGLEKAVVRPLPRRELSAEDWETIDKEIGELLDGE